MAGHDRRQADDGFQQRALAAAIGTAERRQAAFAEIAGQVMDGGMPVIGDGEIADRDRRRTFGRDMQRFAMDMP